MQRCEVCGREVYAHEIVERWHGTPAPALAPRYLTPHGFKGWVRVDQGVYRKVRACLDCAPSPYLAAHIERYGLPRRTGAAAC